MFSNFNEVLKKMMNLMDFNKNFNEGYTFFKLIFLLPGFNKVCLFICLFFVVVVVEIITFEILFIYLFTYFT